MLLRSKTFLLSLIEDQQLSCVIYMQHYPYIHLIVILFVQFILINIYFFFITYLFSFDFVVSSFSQLSPSYHRNYSIAIQWARRKRCTWNYFIGKRTDINIRLCLIRFLVQMVRIDEEWWTYTSMNFYRWLIEASTIPYVLLPIFSNYCMGYIDSFFDQCKSFQVCAIMLKVPLFFLMRYAENQPDCFLKDMEGWIFYALCKSSSKWNIY